VDQLGLNAGAIYYTDVDLVPGADLSARSTFEFTPRGPPRGAAPADRAR
jgi:hypothetical protein